MKLLIAVMTCHQLDYFIDNQTTDWLNSQGLRFLDVVGRQTAQRETWLHDEIFSLVNPDLFLNYKFFFGQEVRRRDVKPNQRPGTAAPAAPLRPAASDEVYLPCGDGYIFNSSKMKEICRYAVNNGYDYVLRVDDDTYVDLPKLLATDWSSYDYAGAATGAFHPGSCVFLSRAACLHVIDARITNFADDLWVGQVMNNAGIPRHDIDGIIHGFGQSYAIRFDNIKGTEFSALHSCTPDTMRRLWTLRMTSLSARQKAMVGAASKITLSPSAPQDSVDEKSSSPATSPTLQGLHLSGSDLNSSTTSRLGTTQLLSDLGSSVIGSPQTNTSSDTLSTAISEML